MTDNTFQLAAEDFDPTECHKRTGNGYLMLGFFSSHIPWNAISNLGGRWSYKALLNDLLLPFTMIISKFSWTEYALTGNAIRKQFRLPNKDSLALDGGESTYKLAITSVIIYYRDRNWALREVQLAFNEVGLLFCSSFES
jgi:hypothetical protein